MTQSAARVRAPLRELRWVCRLAAALSLSLWASGSARADALIQRIEGRISTGALSVREDLLVPYAFTGPSLNIGASYGLMFGAHGFDLSIGFGSAGVWTRDKDAGLYIHNEIAAAYRGRVYARGPRVVWLGALVRSTHELAYLASWDDTHGYWLDTIMLGPTAAYAERVTDKLTLEAAAELSLIGVASRPPARRLNKQDALSTGVYHFDRLGNDPELAYLGHTSLFRLEALLRWRRQAERYGAGFGLGLETRLSRAREPAPFTSWYTGLLASFPWSWP